MNWFDTKLKYLADMKSGDIISSESIDPEGDYPVYGGGSLRGYTNKYTHEGELILIGRQGAHCGAVRKVNGKIYASEHAIVVTKKNNIDNEWLFYLLDSMNLNQYSISAAQPGLSVNMLKNLEVKIPSYNSQVSIRRFINNRIEKFEKIILNKELLIALLEHQRQSIITEAVTKGLNPNVKMKDSGVEWIGEIPEQWEIKRLKNVLYLNPSKNEVNHKKHIDVTFLPMENIIAPNDVDYSLKKSIEDVYNGYTYFRENDLVLAKVTPCFENGNLSVMRGLKNGLGFGTTELHVLRSKDKQNIDFYYYLVQSSHFKQQAVSTMYGVGGLKRIPNEFIMNFKLGVPPKEEQTLIVDFLNTKINEITNIKKLINIQIEKLKEYRQSLIYEAVTGKIDVSEMELEEVR